MPDGRETLYLWLSDWPATICAIAVGWLLVRRWQDRRRPVHLPPIQ
jgi:hypothetical protein